MGQSNLYLTIPNYTHNIRYMIHDRKFMFQNRNINIEFESDVFLRTNSVDRWK